VAPRLAPIALVVSLATAGARAATPPPAPDASILIFQDHRRATRERPPAVMTACSFREPACVHATAGVHPAEVAAALRDAEHALRTYRALGLPAPLADVDRGGSPAYDLYLAQGAEPPATAIDATVDVSLLDRRAAFSVLPPRGPRAGCEARAAVAHAAADALLLGLDATTSDGVLAMASTHLASLAAPCLARELGAIDEAQRAPERAITTCAPGLPCGGALLPWYLDEAWGPGRPGLVLTALVAIAAQRPEEGAIVGVDEPDAFDALRVSLKGQGRTLGDLLLDFAIDRAFLGSRSDGAHLVDAAKLGDLGRVRFAWSVPFDTLPRRLAHLAPVEPTGATYLWIDAKAATLDAVVRFAFDWEPPALFRWAVVKVGADGAEVGRIVVPGIEGSTHAEQSVHGVGGLAGLLVVGTNAGDPRPALAFDPDEPLAPRGYEVTVASDTP
jgi:GNAT superfamily N-acetyltransferase